MQNAKNAPDFECERAKAKAFPCCYILALLSYYYKMLVV